jgi:fructose-bisphosphate aldolase class II
MRKAMAERPEEFDPRAFLKAATTAAKGLCKQRFEAFGCAGQASRIKPLPLEKMAGRYPRPHKAK